MNANVAFVSVAKEPGVANPIEDSVFDRLFAADNFKRLNKIRRDVARRIDDKNERRREFCRLGVNPRRNDNLFNLRLFHLVPFVRFEL